MSSLAVKCPFSIAAAHLRLTAPSTRQQERSSSTAKAKAAAKIKTSGQPRDYGKAYETKSMDPISARYLNGGRDTWHPLAGAESHHHDAPRGAVEGASLSAGLESSLQEQRREKDFEFYLEDLEYWRGERNLESSLEEQRRAVLGSKKGSRRWTATMRLGKDETEGDEASVPGLVTSRSGHQVLGEIKSKGMGTVRLSLDEQRKGDLVLLGGISRRSTVTTMGPALEGQRRDGHLHSALEEQKRGENKFQSALEEHRRKVLGSTNGSTRWIGQAKDDISKALIQSDMNLRGTGPPSLELEEHRRKVLGSKNGSKHWTRALAEMNIRIPSAGVLA